MRVIEKPFWIFYVEDTSSFEKEKVGKWMYFFDDKKFVESICEEAVKTNVVAEAKHSDEEEGVACFYLNYDDMETHKKVINYFIQRNLIRKTKNGRYHNISFKLDEQTRAGEYGENFISSIKLNHFIDLESGEWII